MTALASLNDLPKNDLKDALHKCCGSTAWVEKMVPVFPVADVETLLREARKKWFDCEEKDWLEAFSHHPKIGDAKSLAARFPETAHWAQSEQGVVTEASTQLLEALAEGNQDYEKKFGFIFIVCASGKSAEEMLRILRARLPNSREDEIKIAMVEQHKITELRLKKIIG
jgi:2-oxo-4-hydroxy-4-carboxy-5-ureidoimidazoline decarboxylase